MLIRTFRFQYLFCFVVHNEKQYEYVAGFQGTIVSKLHKGFFLAQSFKFAHLPTKKSNGR